jgi:outer membrane lipoprotein-sorting protein
MKTSKVSMHLKFVLIELLLLIVTMSAFAQDAKDIVSKADTKFKGEKTSYSEMSMTIVRPKYQRNLEFKSWSEGNENSLTLITAPAKEKGQTFLKSGNNLWSWNPTIQRLIKFPPAMMSQGWMGSDFSNDDILKESSIVVDYTHSITEDEFIVKTQLGHTVKTFQDRTIPSVMEIIPDDEEGFKTIVTIIDMKFNNSIAKNFFSQQNMKRIR